MSDIVIECLSFVVNAQFDFNKLDLSWVADCSQAGIGYTKPQEDADNHMLRIARRPGSVTLCLPTASRNIQLRPAVFSNK
jgi:hypothetical protein